MQWGKPEQMDCRAEGSEEEGTKGAEKECPPGEGGGGGMRRGAEKECTYEDERELVGGGEVQS